MSAGDNNPPALKPLSENSSRNVNPARIAAACITSTTVPDIPARRASR